MPTTREDPPSTDPVADLLARPRDQRTREYKYRFAQSVVFGLPVLALTFFGASLGGRDAARWVSTFSLLLTGWVLYIGATGMFFEGIILLARRRPTADLVVAVLAITSFVIGLIRTIQVFNGANPPNPWFALTILLIATWSALQWWRHAK